MLNEPSGSRDRGAAGPGDVGAGHARLPAVRAVDRAARSCQRAVVSRRHHSARRRRRADRLVPPRCGGHAPGESNRDARARRRAHRRRCPGTVRRSLDIEPLGPATRPVAHGHARRRGPRRPAGHAAPASARRSSSLPATPRRSPGSSRWSTSTISWTASTAWPRRRALVTGTGLALAGWDPFAAAAGAAIAGGCGGFLLHNWSPARIFMGDVGSGTLGFLFAAVPLLAPPIERPRAVLFVATSLSLFLADATWTLVKRVARGARWYEAHREHAYQRLVIGGWTHARTTTLLDARRLAHDRGCARSVAHRGALLVVAVRGAGRVLLRDGAVAGAPRRGRLPRGSRAW